MLTINAEKRDLELDKDALRADKKTPGVFYGPKEEATPVTLSEVELMKVYKEAGESSVIKLKSDSDEHEVLIKDIQFDAVSDRPVHVDFYVIEKGKKISVSIPLEFVGVSPAVKSMSGVLVKVVHELDVESLPSALPHEIEVNIESLVDFESQILAKDIALPEGVELDMNPEEVIALVQAPKEEVEEAPAADIADIEVEKKGKEESADAGEGDAAKSAE